MSDENIVSTYLHEQLILAIRESRDGDIVVIEGAIDAFNNIYYKSVGVDND